MKKHLKILTAVFTAAVITAGCGGSEKGEAETPQAEENVGEESAEDEKHSSAGEETERDDSDIVSEENNAESAFDMFFDCYADTELSESCTKVKNVEIIMYPETDNPFEIESMTYIQKEKNGDDYNAYIETDDTVNGESNQSEAVYSDGYLYYEYEGEKYKEAYEDWDALRVITDGYYFKLYDYTVNNVHVTNYSDGYKKIEFGFDLQNLSEAPDEQIFEILSATASTYKNLSFNEASFEGYVSPEGYVTSYIMYYDGQVAAGTEKTDLYTFKYTTAVNYSDINNTTVDVPENTDEYTLVEVEEEEETGY
ncbi:MAG: hypothetical protein LUD81_05825 [Clostridiales bacterium]|nr:hypothetical protein [Clostridiales bacterium]